MQQIDQGGRGEGGGREGGGGALVNVCDVLVCLRVELKLNLGRR
jgi:hypothetical protein